MKLLVAGLMTVIIAWCKSNQSLLWNIVFDSYLGHNKNPDSYLPVRCY